jgi:hypothetical protein
VPGIICVLFLLAGDGTAASGGTDTPGTLQTVTFDVGRAEEGGVLLAGRDARQQLVVTGHYAGGRLRDLSHEVAYEVVPAGIVAIDPTGLVTPLREGRAAIHATAANGVKAATMVTVTHLVEDLPVHFANQVVPVFTKFGCNAGGCHGKASGQNGFKLSLLGFEPEEDYESLVKEARGRRLFPAAPAASLLLRKATATTPHGGGKRLAEDSPYYELLLRWVVQGMPYGRPDDPIITRIEVAPGERVLDRGGRQQLAVRAHLSDGSTRDVTRMTQFEANYPEMAEVTETGLVAVRSVPGSVAIMARFQSHVDVFRAVIPAGPPLVHLPPPNNFIDEHVFRQLRRLGLPPSERCDDATFVRRATLDIAGRLPTREEAEAFLADRGPDKDARLVERLLASPDYAAYFAGKWSAILRNRRASAADDPKPTLAFHAWIRDGLHHNRPYDQLVRGVLTAAGEEVKDPPVAWYREVKDAAAQVEDAAQLFLGQRLGCARCHHHPFEKWSQEDYYGLAAFFSRLEVKDLPAPRDKKGVATGPRPPLRVSYRPGPAEAAHPKTGRPVKPAGLGGPPLEIPAEADARQRLADWMVAKDNPFFARALVNRYWKHFFGCGLVEPEDDLRRTNPPSNPELLDALARHFLEAGCDLKHLVRTLCTAQVYRLSSVPTASNAADQQNFSHYLPKRLHAEVLLDAVDAVTLSRTEFKGMPPGTRAVQLPDNQFESYFLSVFGRPDSSSACECERSAEATLAQCLHMFNSAEVLGKIAGTKGSPARAARLAADPRPHDQKLRELYLTALAREPSREELALLLGYLEEKNAQAAYEDIIWAVLNTKEFLFNH